MRESLTYQEAGAAVRDQTHTLLFLQIFSREQ
jgi:hypothetical protein